MLQEPVFSERLTVVRRDYHDRIVGDAALLELTEQLSQLGIEIGDRAIVCRAKPAGDLRIRLRGTLNDLPGPRFALQVHRPVWRRRDIR